MKKFGKQAQRVGKTLSVGLTAPIIAFGAKGVFAFDQQAKALAQVEAGLISTGNAANKTFKGLQDQAAQLQKTTLFGDEEILQGATAQLLTFTNIANSQFDRTQQVVLDLSTRLGQDLKSSAIQLGKALNDPVANLSALSRSGIQFSKDQKKVINSLAKSGKLAEAQNIILEELEKQYGGAAKAAAKAGLGPFKQLGNQIGDLSEDFGKLIVEALLPFIDRVKSFVAGLQDMSDSAKKTTAIVAGLLAALGPLIFSIGFAATNVVPGLIIAFNKLRAAIIAVSAAARANPFTAIATVVGLLTVTMLSFRRETEKVVKTQSLLDQVSQQAQKSIAGEQAKLKELLFIARDEQVSKEQRLKAVRELNRISPKYLGNLRLETINTDKAKEAIDRYNEALLRSAKVKAAQEKLTEIQAKLIEIEINGSKARQRILEKEDEVKKALRSGDKVRANALQAEIDLMKGLGEFGSLRNDLLKQQSDILLNIIKNNDDFNISLDSTAAAVDAVNSKLKELSELKPFGGQGIGADVSELETQLSILEQAQAEYSSTSDEFKLLGEQIASVQRLIGALQGEIQGVGVPETEGGDRLQNLVDKMLFLKTVAQEVSNSVGSAFENMGNRFVDSLKLASTGFEGFLGTLAKTVTKLISMMLSAAISAAIQGASLASAFSGPLGIFSQPAFIATAVNGIVSAFASIPKFADGGVVFGPTLGMMGEYAGARSNPEVIAPLDKLKDLMGSASGGVDVQLGLGSVIRGSDLELVINRVIEKKSRYG